MKQGKESLQCTTVSDYEKNYKQPEKEFYSSEQKDTKPDINHTYCTIHTLNFTRWTIFQTSCKQNRLLRNIQYECVFPWLIKIVPLLTDLHHEPKDYAKHEQITIGSERYFSDGGKKTISNPDRSVS